MEKEINVAEILKNKPVGIKLYSPICGECTLKYVYDKDNKDERVYIATKVRRENFYFEANGKYTNKGEVMLFPSKQMHSLGRKVMY